MTAKKNKNIKKKTIKPGKNIVAPMTNGLKKQILSFINQGAKEITVDFSGVEDLDSKGLGLLIAANNSLKITGGKLKIKHVSKNMYKFFHTIHLDQHFEVV